jgi:magnesium transporter
MIRSLFRSRDGSLAHDLPPAQLGDALADKGGLLWLDIVTPGEDLAQVQKLLGDLFGFHPLALDDALHEDHVPRVDDWQGYLYIVLHAADLRELDLFLGPNYLVTIREGPVPPLENLWDQCFQAPDRRLAGSPARLLYALADAVASGYMPAVDGLDEEIDQVEADVFHRPRPQLIRRIFRLRGSLLRLRRTLASLREVMNRLARDDYAVIEPGERVYFRDVYDHLVRLYDIVEGLRDLAAGALDSYLSVTSNRINEVMRTLTVVNVLFLPLTFLVGFFGMNFFGESFNVHSPLPGSMLFWLCVCLMVVNPFAMWWWMSRRGLLRPGVGGEEQPGKHGSGDEEGNEGR